MPFVSEPCSRNDRAATARIFSWVSAFLSGGYLMPLDYASNLKDARTSNEGCTPTAEFGAPVWSRGVTRWFRWGLSLAGPFACRCLTNPIMLRLHTPLIEPDRRS